jgi:hypothetical protein
LITIRHICNPITGMKNQTIHHSTRGIDMLGRVTGMVSRAPDRKRSIPGH